MLSVYNCISLDKKVLCQGKIETENTIWCWMGSGYIYIFFLYSTLLLELFKLETYEESVKNMLANASIL